MAEALASAATDLEGLARPLVVEPDLQNSIMKGEQVTNAVRPIKTGIRMIVDKDLMAVSWYTRQISRIARGKTPKQHDRGLLSLMEVLGVMTTRSVRSRLRAGE